MTDAKTMYAGDEIMPACPFCETGEVDVDGYCAECGLLRIGGDEVRIEPVALPAGEILARFAIGAGAADARGAGAPIELPAGTYTVGRADSDVVVPDAYVSRMHAEIVVGADGITITDLGSTNGTFIGGERLDARVPRKLETSELLTFGKTDIGWEFLGAPAASVEPAAVSDTPVAVEPSPMADAADSPAEAVEQANEEPAAAEALSSGWFVRFVDSDIPDAPLPHGRSILGRKAGRADIVVPGDGYISSAHLSIEINDSGVYVIDQNSTNGSFIGGSRLDPLVPIKIESGARIRIGETEIEIAFAEEASSENSNSTV